jgi:hypothetical protein
VRFCLPRKQVLFTPSGWLVAPTVTLETYVAGETGGVDITFTPFNPLPADAKLIVEFPNTFVSVAPAATAATSDDLDGSFVVSTLGRVVTIARDNR